MAPKTDKGGEKSSDNDKSNVMKDIFRWSQYDRSKKLLKLLNHEKERGASPTNFPHLAELFNRQTGNNILPVQVKNHYDYLKDKHKAYVQLMSMTGIGIDKSTGAVHEEELQSPRYKAFIKVN